MVATTNLHYSYTNGPSFAFPDLSCSAGERLLIIGESGKGKTTLLHLLAGMLRPSSGSVMLAGQDTTSMSGPQLDRYRGQHVGIVFQTAHFVASIPVIENVVLPQYLSGRRTDTQKAMQVLERLGVAHKAQARPGKLSVGEQQRVAIARAVINDPSVILADEPTSALDDKHTEEVIRLLEEQASLTGASLLIVTHDNRLKERFTHRIQL